MISAQPRSCSLYKILAEVNAEYGRTTAEDLARSGSRMIGYNSGLMSDWESTNDPSARLVIEARERLARFEALPHWEQLDVRELGNATAHYTQQLDGEFIVRLPEARRFVSPVAYGKTVFHEYAHATGWELDRFERRTKGWQECYRPAEEIVAELAACLVTVRVGLKALFPYRATALYNRSWAGAQKTKGDLEPGGKTYATLQKHAIDAADMLLRALGSLVSGSW